LRGRRGWETVPKWSGGETERILKGASVLIVTNILGRGTAVNRRYHG
jgi:hypothetical protein